MTYDHDVKVNGKWYKAGEEIPALVTTEKKEKVEPKVVEPEVKVETEQKPVEEPKRSKKK